MYFKDKINTNIDKEFGKKKKFSIKKIDFNNVFSPKVIIFSGVIVLVNIGIIHKKTINIEAIAKPILLKKMATKINNEI